MTTASTPDPLALIQSGKVRELYDAGGDRLLMVASDRISRLRRGHGRAHPRQGPGAHGHDRLLVRGAGRPGAQTTWSVPMWPTSRTGPPRLPGGLGYLAGRVDARPPGRDAPHRVHRARLPGRSAYKEYEKAGTVHGTAMPPGLRHADRLPEPIFTPSTKATEGHDLNIDIAEAVDLVGQEAAEAASAICLAAYPRAAARAERQGIVIWPTPSSSSASSTATLSICDEVSRRTRPASGRRSRWCPGNQRRPSFDKQPLRDWLDDTALGQARRRPPALPDEVVSATSARVHRGLRAGLRPTPGRLVRCLSMARSARVPAQFSVLVEVRLRAGIADPQGATIERALPALGFDGVSARAGREVVPLRDRRPTTRPRPWPRPPRWPTGCWPTRSSRSPR